MTPEVARTAVLPHHGTMPTFIPPHYIGNFATWFVK